MTERLLQFIWQFQYFNKNELTTVSEESVHIIFQGQYNSNQGPDFSDAKVRIGNTTWAGTIELHIRPSDWERHNHQSDSNYSNVILHVVWEDDEDRNPISTGTLPIKSRASPVIPVLELKSRVAKILLSRFEDLMRSTSFIPCEKMIYSVAEITWMSWKERLLAERLLRKAKMVEVYLKQNNYHWEETFWWLLARNFGMKVNADAFEAIARSIPLNILAKQKHQIHQIEAILFGQAGLLEIKFEEDYPTLLQKEYRFQKTKLDLRPVTVPLLFLRMRPVNFPTIRLAQLAMLVHESAHLFSRIREATCLNDIRKWLDLSANDYWHYHYRFDEISAFKKKKIGETMVSNIIINTLAPVLFTYGSYHNVQKYKNKALQWLEETRGEKNSITRDFFRIGIENKTAYDSQALIELKNEYCNKKKCLECSVGNSILKN